MSGLGERMFRIFSVFNVLTMTIVVEQAWCFQLLTLLASTQTDHTSPLSYDIQ
jgi:hypothetical protein